VTVSSTTNKQSYNGNGSQSVFAYTFKIFADTDIKVYVGTALKTLSTHYTLSGVGSSGGGNVTFTAGNLPAAGTGNVTILRSLALTQGVDLINYGKFDAEVVEAQYDKLVMMVQQLQEQADRTIRFSTTVSDAGGVEITDTISERSGKVLAYDANGDLSVANELGDWQGNWSTTTTYAVRDLVLDAATNNVYTCLAGHTAGTLSTDVSSSKWALVINASAVANSASAAASSASTATTQAGTATTQAGIATTKASEASASASTATTKASTATTQASTATTKASEASTSASNAATSETNAGSSASSASTSAGTATTQAGISTTKAGEASTSESTATTKAGEASTSASTATTQAGTATTQAGIATTKASEASSSASTATTQASTATTKASEASGSATNAANSAASAAASLDNFDDRYLGAKSSAPTLDNDGNALVEGAMYFDSSANGMKVYDGADWIAASAAGTASMLTYKYTATSGQTTFTGADANSLSLTYTVANIIVMLNGITLDAADFTATSGTSVVLGTGATTGDELVVVAFKSFTVADHYTQAQADALLGAKAPLASPVFTGPTTVNRLSTDGTIVDLQKDGTTVGSVGIESGGFYIDGEADHAGLRFGGSAIGPRDGGAEDDGNINLGNSTNRFKDLYLGGGVYLGGTGSANKLDDYEEGTFTATLTSATGSITTNTSNNKLSYTKIGRAVFISGTISVSSVSSPSGDLNLTGLPFSNASGDEQSERASFNLQFLNLATSISGNLSTYMTASSTSFRIRDNGDTTSGGGGAMGNHIKASTFLRVSGHYFV